MWMEEAGEKRVKRVEGEVERVEGSEAERAKFKIYEHVVVPVVVIFAVVV